MAPRNNEVPTDQSSPFFVHLSDGPSSVTVSPVLDGSNYHSWARSMRRVLGGKMKYGFFDGTILILFFAIGTVATKMINYQK
jgi:hypothetical protein